MNKTPDTRETILAGERAFAAALSRARARGGPAAELDALCLRPGAPPQFFQWPLSRYTLGIERLQQKRAAMPGVVTAMEFLLFFTRGEEAARLLQAFDEEAQQWRADIFREDYEAAVAEVSALADLLRERQGREVIAWISAELATFHRLSAGDESDNRTAAGSDGSRVGWWPRAAEEIVHRFGRHCPPGSDVLQWAVWQFPLNDWLALQPAALERAGIETPDHYAVVEARAARAKAKAAARESAAAAATSAKPKRTRAAAPPEP